MWKSKENSLVRRMDCYSTFYRPGVYMSTIAFVPYTTECIYGKFRNGCHAIRSHALGEGRWWSHIEQVINIINRHLNYRINYVYTKNNFNTSGMNLLQQDLDSIKIWNAYLHFNTSINALCLVLTLNLLATNYQISGDLPLIIPSWSWSLLFHKFIMEQTLYDHITAKAHRSPCLLCCTFIKTNETWFAVSYSEFWKSDVGRWLFMILTFMLWKHKKKAFKLWSTSRGLKKV